MSLEIYLDNYQNITKKSKTNFLLTFNFLDQKQKNAIFLVYAFSRISDDIVDSNDSADIKLNNLNEWESKFKQRSSSQIVLLKQLNDIMITYNIPEVYFNELISGMRQDITKNRYETISELLDYCYKVASTIGLICIHIFGFSSEKTKEYAKNLGIALQLTNIIRDVFEDVDINRIYIPMNELSRFNVTENDILNKSYTKEFNELMRFQYERALLYYEKASINLEESEQKSMIVAQMMRNIYFELLKKIQSHDFENIHHKIKLSKFKKILIIIKTYIFNR